MWVGESSGGKKRCDTRSTGLTCEGQVWKIWVVHKCRITNRFMCLFFLKLFFWLSNNCCIGSLRVLTAVLEKLWRQSWGKGVYVCLCVVWRFVGDVEMLVCAYTSTGTRDTCNNNQIYTFDLSNWARCTFGAQFFLMKFQMQEFPCCLEWIEQVAT